MITLSTYLLKMVYNWINIIQDYLLPPTCILCRGSGVDCLDICQPCYELLPKNTPCCPCCAALLEIPIAKPGVCGGCLSHPPSFDQVHAPFIYQAAIRYLILGLKFSGNDKNARLLGLLLADYVTSCADLPDVILPVPLHKARYRTRGYNQSIEIARIVAEKLAIPLDLTSCIRHRDTPHQSLLPSGQRRKNVNNAFSLIKPIKAAHVAILDDVLTSGATSHELALVLKKAGVKTVDVWVCARA